jgi:hypothetical protein
MPKNLDAPKWFIGSYNLAMSLYSLVTFVLMIASIQQLYADGTGLYGNDCKAAFSQPLFRNLVKVFYWSKFIEYMDTMFLIVKGKPVSILQSFHHIGAPWDMWIFIMHENEATWIFVLFNSLIHTIMYGYYGCTLFKIHVPKIIKGSITSLQILQFVTGFTLVWPYKNIACYGENHYLMFGFYFNYFYVGTVLALFMNFYYHNYLSQSKRKLA